MAKAQSKEVTQDSLEPKQEAPAQQAAPKTPPPPQDGIIAKKAPPREPIPAGNHMARCYLMILIGTVKEEFKKGSGDWKTAEKIRIGWEFPHLMKQFKEGEEEKPMVISAEYTLSTSNRANLRKMIDSWRGKPLTEQEADAFDVTKLLGKACMINVLHKAGEGKNAGKVFEQISAIASMPKGTACPDAINDIKYFNYGSKFDAKFVEALPAFIKDKIKSSIEWQAKVADGTVAAQIGVINDAEHVPAGQGGRDTPLASIPDEDLPF